MNKSPALTPVQYSSLLVAAAFGYGILALPRYLCDAAGRDGWAVLLPAGGLLCLSAGLCLALCRRHPGRELASLLRSLLPRPAGLALCACYLLFFLAVAASSIRMVAEATMLYLLPNTPLWAIGAVYALFLFYTMRPGRQSPGRFCELTGVLLLLSLGLLLPALTSAQLTNLSPVLTASPRSMLSALPLSCYSFGLSTLILIYCPMTEHRRLARRHTWIAVGVVVAFFLLIALFSLLVLGPDAVAHMLFPVITLYKSVSVPAVERLDLFFLTLWTVLAVRPCLCYTFAAVHLSSFLPLLSRLSHTARCGAFSALIFALTVVQREVSAAVFLTNYLGYAFFFLGVAVPCLLLLRSGGKERPCD